MNKPLKPEDLRELKGQLRQAIAQDTDYWIINGVKCEAIQTSKTYEEFQDRVAGALLRPVDKSREGAGGKSWNAFARKEID